MHVYVYVYKYIYIYIHVYRERERHTYTYACLYMLLICFLRQSGCGGLPLDASSSRPWAFSPASVSPSFFALHSSYEEFTRLAETRLAQNSFNYVADSARQAAEVATD